MVLSLVLPFCKYCTQKYEKEEKELRLYEQSSNTKSSFSFIVIWTLESFQFLIFRFDIQGILSRYDHL